MRLVRRSLFESDVGHVHVHAFHWGADSMVTEVVKYGIEGELPSDDYASGAVRHSVPHTEVLSDEDVRTVVEKEGNERAVECRIWQSVEVLFTCVRGC